jgi:membrane-associated phospholipid phosphatase
MLLLYKDNPWFFGAFALFLCLGAGLCALPQGELLIQLNEQRNPFADVFFQWITKVGEAYGYAGVFILLFVYKRRAAWGIPLLGLGVSLLSWIGKSVFKHPRPFRYFEENHLLSQLEFIPGVRLHKGLTSFPSGHTMAAFALFSLLAFCFPRKPWLSIGCFLLALLVGVSRMYLVQHFFKDIYLGAILGLGMGVLAYLILERIEQKLLAKA